MIRERDSAVPQARAKEMQAFTTVDIFDTTFAVHYKTATFNQPFCLCSVQVQQHHLFVNSLVDTQLVTSTFNILSVNAGMDVVIVDFKLFKCFFQS